MIDLLFEILLKIALMNTGKILDENTGVHMQNITTFSHRKERVNFFFPSELNQKANAVVKELGFSSYSDLVRQALTEFLDRVERNKINREIVEASRHFFEIEKKVADEWRVTETDF